jgi:DNA-binding Lrp family transcriptional regulator
MRASLDGTDSEIVALLIADARASLADIGRKVSLSPPAVKRVIDRLRSTSGVVGIKTLMVLGAWSPAR